MTALILSLRPGPSEALSAGQLAARSFFGALGGLVIPATPALAAPASCALVPGERYVGDVAATIYDGPTATGVMISELDGPAPRAFWCAVGVALPRGPRLERQPWLRFGPPPVADRDVLWPIAIAARARDGIELTFARGGAPFVPPPSRDRGGPIDQTWTEAADLALHELASALARLSEEPLRVALVIEGASQLAKERLDRALRGVAGLSIETR